MTTVLTETQRRFLERYVAPLPAQAIAAGSSDYLDGLGARARTVLANNPPDASRIRATLSMVQEQAADGRMSAALKAAATLERLLSQPAGAGEVRAGTVAFQRSRILWLSTKAQIRAGLDRFRAAVADCAADEDDRAEIMEGVALLLQDFDAFDNRLEDQLDQLTNLPDDADRDRLKAEASRTLADYRAVLSGPLFSRIDDNPFVPLNVAASAQASLSTIGATLS